MKIVTNKSAFVRENEPDTNFGDNVYLDVVSYLTYDERSYVEFDISNKPSTVNIVKLWLYCNASSSYTRTHDAKRTTSSWSETTMTWNTGQPTTTDTNKASRTATVADSGKWVSWDITNLFNDETGYVLGILIRDATESYTFTANWRFNSDGNASNRPYIEINGYYVKVGGNDSLDGQSWANAWVTINKAATTVPDGSIVHIGFGDYTNEPATNKIAPQNVGASGIIYQCETATTGGGTGTVSIEQNT